MKAKIKVLSEGGRGGPPMKYGVCFVDCPLPIGGILHPTSVSITSIDSLNSNEQYLTQNMSNHLKVNKAITLLFPKDIAFRVFVVQIFLTILRGQHAKKLYSFKSL